MKTTYTSLLTLIVSAGLASAASISLNFSENDTNQNWTNGTDLIGPLSTTTASFNTSNNPPGVAGLPTRTGSLATGGLSGLLDDSATATTASVSWSSATAWFNGSGIGSNEARLAVGYLDDGGSGASVTFSNVPYANYNVYVLLGSDQGPGPNYTSQDFTVNGAAVIGSTFTAYRDLGESGGGWVEANSTTVGNYIVASNQSGSTATILGAVGAGAAGRGSITGVIIQEVVPEPSTALLGGLAGLILLVRRRR